MHITATWKEEDIKVGMMVYRYSDPIEKNLSYIRSTTHKIGFLAGGRGDKKYVMISVLSDGMVGSPETLAEMVESLNKDYIPMPLDVFLKAAAANGRQLDFHQSTKA